MSRRKDSSGQLDQHLVRQTDRRTNRQADGQTKSPKRTDRQTHLGRQTDMNRQADGQTKRQADS